MFGEIIELNYDEIKDVFVGFWFGEKFKDEYLLIFDDVVKIVNEYNMNLNVELKGIIGLNGLVFFKSMVK